MILSDDEKKQRASNGPIYILVDISIRAVHRISPVEWKKKGILKFSKKSDPEDIRKTANLAIDAFIILKWLFLFTIWMAGVTHWLAVSVSVFLLVMNLHTYFWYHLWTIDKSGSIPGLEFRERRRFVNLIFAISYSMGLYAYLYHRVLQSEFTWPTTISPWVSATVFSVGNALTGFSGDLKPITATATLITSSQLVMTFVFVAMLLSNSVPRPKT
ncbi:hypothetical protein K2P97_10145 [bacterium]|nr:hypothetical protein [bacterium]